MPAPDWIGLWSKVNQLARAQFTLVALATVGASIVLGILAYQHFHDPKVSEEIGRLKGLLREDSLRTKSDSVRLAALSVQLDSANARTSKAIVRWNTRVVHDTVPLPPTATPHDTIQHQARQIRECKDAGSELVESAIPLQSTCEQFKADAKKTIADWTHKYSHLDSLYKKGAPPKRWNVSLAVGYGYAFRLDSIAPRRQVFVGLSVGRSLVQW